MNNFDSKKSFGKRNSTMLRFSSWLRLATLFAMISGSKLNYNYYKQSSHQTTIRDITYSKNTGVIAAGTKSVIKLDNKGISTTEEISGTFLIDESSKLEDKYIQERVKHSKVIKIHHINSNFFFCLYESPDGATLSASTEIRKYSVKDKNYETSNSNKITPLKPPFDIYSFRIEKAGNSLVFAFGNEDSFYTGTYSQSLSVEPSSWTASLNPKKITVDQKTLLKSVIFLVGSQFLSTAKQPKPPIIALSEEGNIFYLLSSESFIASSPTMNMNLLVKESDKDTTKAKFQRIEVHGQDIVENSFKDSFFAVTQTASNSDSPDLYLMSIYRDEITSRTQLKENSQAKLTTIKDKIVTLQSMKNTGYLLIREIESLQILFYLSYKTVQSDLKLKLRKIIEIDRFNGIPGIGKELLIVNFALIYSFRDTEMPVVKLGEPNPSGTENNFFVIRDYNTNCLGPSPEFKVLPCKFKCPAKCFKCTENRLCDECQMKHEVDDSRRICKSRRCHASFYFKTITENDKKDDETPSTEPQDPCIKCPKENCYRCEDETGECYGCGDGYSFIKETKACLKVNQKSKTKIEVNTKKVRTTQKLFRKFKKAIVIVFDANVVVPNKDVFGIKLIDSEKVWESIRAKSADVIRQRMSLVLDLERSRELNRYLIEISPNNLANNGARKVKEIYKVDTPDVYFQDYPINLDNLNYYTTFLDPIMSILQNVLYYLYNVINFLMLFLCKDTSILMLEAFQSLQLLGYLFVDVPINVEGFTEIYRHNFIDLIPELGLIRFNEFVDGEPVCEMHILLFEGENGCYSWNNLTYYMIVLIILLLVRLGCTTIGLIYKPKCKSKFEAASMLPWQLKLGNWMKSLLTIKFYFMFLSGFEISFLFGAMINLKYWSMKTVVGMLNFALSCTIILVYLTLIVAQYFVCSKVMEYGYNYVLTKPQPIDLQQTGESSFAYSFARKFLFTVENLRDLSRNLSLYSPLITRILRFVMVFFYLFFIGSPLLQLIVFALIMLGGALVFCIATPFKQKSWNVLKIAKFSVLTLFMAVLLILHLLRTVLSERLKYWVCEVLLVLSLTILVILYLGFGLYTLRKKYKEIIEKLRSQNTVDEKENAKQRSSIANTIFGIIGGRQNPEKQTAAKEQLSESSIGFEQDQRDGNSVIKGTGSSFGISSVSSVSRNDSRLRKVSRGNRRNLDKRRRANID